MKPPEPIPPRPETSVKPVWTNGDVAGRHAIRIYLQLVGMAGTLVCRDKFWRDLKHYVTQQCPDEVEQESTAVLVVGVLALVVGCGVGFILGVLVHTGG